VGDGGDSGWSMLAEMGGRRPFPRSLSRGKSRWARGKTGRDRCKGQGCGSRWVFQKPSSSARVTAEAREQFGEDGGGGRYAWESLLLDASGRGANRSWEAVESRPDHPECRSGVGSEGGDALGRGGCAWI
jgi:hypothetical protein